MLLRSALPNQHAMHVSAVVQHLPQAQAAVPPYGPVEDPCMCTMHYIRHVHISGPSMQERMAACLLHATAMHIFPVVAALLSFPMAPFSFPCMRLAAETAAEADPARLYSCCTEPPTTHALPCRACSTQALLAYAPPPTRKLRHYWGLRGRTLYLSEAHDRVTLSRLLYTAVFGQDFRHSDTRPLHEQLVAASAAYSSRASPSVAPGRAIQRGGGSWRSRGQDGCADITVHRSHPAGPPLCRSAQLMRSMMEAFAETATHELHDRWRQLPPAPLWHPSLQQPARCTTLRYPEADSHRGRGAYAASAVASAGTSAGAAPAGLREREEVPSRHGAWGRRVPVILHIIDALLEDAPAELPWSRLHSTHSTPPAAPSCDGGGPPAAPTSVLSPEPATAASSDGVNVRGRCACGSCTLTVTVADCTDRVLDGGFRCDGDAVLDGGSTAGDTARGPPDTAAGHGADKYVWRNSIPNHEGGRAGSAVCGGGPAAAAAAEAAEAAAAKECEFGVPRVILRPVPVAGVHAAMLAAAPAAAAPQLGWDELLLEFADQQPPREMQPVWHPHCLTALAHPDPHCHGLVSTSVGWCDVAGGWVGEVQGSV